MPVVVDNIAALQARSASVLLKNYARQPIAFTHGQGARLWDTTGRDYIDFCAGLAVNALGYGDTVVAKAIVAQATRLIHVSNLYEVPEQIVLAEKLRALIGYERYFFCNSGAEANEALIKLARAWGKPRGRSRIIVAKSSFHGRTLGALSATAQTQLQEAFGPLLQGFDVVDYGELASIANRLDADVAAVYLETVQAEGGGHFPPEQYLAHLRALCDQHGVLLLLDEVQMGMGRTGLPLAQDSYGIKADAVALAKGLGGGFPIGAMATREHLAEVLGPGSHGSTFGGNPLAATAASAVVDALAAPGFLATVQERGQTLLAAVIRLAADHPQKVTQPRGRGLFVCFNTPDPAALVIATREQGVLVAVAKNNAVRLLPPLTISGDELTEGVARLARAIEGL